MKRGILLVNSNIVCPPVGPLGLEYVGETLMHAGIPLQIADFSFTSDWKSTLKEQLSKEEPLAVGLSVRNTDDCSFISRKSFLPWVREIVSHLRELTAAPVILGGVGFSAMPDAVLQATGADAGIAGDGEEMLVTLAQCIAGGTDYTHVNNLVFWQDGKIVRNPIVYSELQHLPVFQRQLFDNIRYEKLGAMVGIETKRGCTGKCVYCVDPIAKGDAIRFKLVPSVLQELRNLVAQGISWLHLCDSEFNIPLGHAKEVCRAILNSGLGEKVRWYCYCSPIPFDAELAHLMKSAGCAGINFGIDSLCDEQLRRLGRLHTFNDIGRLLRLLHSEGLNYMFDLLVGAPGETIKTAELTIKRAKELEIALVGIALGVRVYPQTTLEKIITNLNSKRGLYPQIRKFPGEPIFYLSPSLGEDATALIGAMINGDPRFLLLATSSEQHNYNYTDDEVLCSLIRQGARGAYWDILRQYRAV